VTLLEDMQNTLNSDCCI